MENDLSNFLDCKQDGDVLVVTMCRPEKHNVLAEQSQFDEFEQLGLRVNGDDSIRVVILTGSGKSFCAGGNVKDMANRSGLFAGAPYELFNNYRRGIQKITKAVYNLEVPVIAAVNGNAIGAGCDLACMCDIRIASDRARFAESFVKLGIIPGDGGAWLLPRAVGLSKAYEMSFTGDVVSGAEALTCGLVSSLVSHDLLMRDAMRLARRMAKNSGPALRLTKKLIREGQNVSLATLLEMSAATQVLSHFTDEHRDLVQHLGDNSNRDAKVSTSDR